MGVSFPGMLEYFCLSAAKTPHASIELQDLIFFNGQMPIILKSGNYIVFSSTPCTWQ